MQNKQAKQGRAMSMTGGIAYGVSYAILITVIGIALLAKMIDIETLAWESVGYGIMITLMISSFISAKVSISKVKRRRLLVGTVSGITYFCLLLITTALFFGGNYYAVGETALLILGGCGTAVLIGENQAKRRTSKRFCTCW